MKVLFDTNVILDFLLERRSRMSLAEELFELVREEKIEAFVTANCITDIHYIVGRKLGDEPARDAVRHSLKMFNVVAVDGKDCAEALDLPVLDYEDALALACSKKENISFVVTNDADFIRSSSVAPIRIVSPNDFLALV